MKHSMLKKLPTLLSLLFMLFFLVASVFAAETQDPRMARLVERVNQHWDEKIRGDMGENYKSYDPFFRARVKKVVYEANMIDIKYISYTLGEIKITENIAKVPGQTVFEIPETMILGQKISVPPRTDTWEDDWIWIDDDWYKVFKLNLNMTYILLFPSFPP
ncbi:MAG: hypothetical protein HZB31_14430 [Nitrospirae bacterium]|nr:hypothetical protein [Nitrospirota bacterium]